MERRGLRVRRIRLHGDPIKQRVPRSRNLEYAHVIKSALRRIEIGIGPDLYQLRRADVIRVLAAHKINRVANRGKLSLGAKRTVTRRSQSPFFNDPFFNNFFGGNSGIGGRLRQQVESSLGSGVIITGDGLVATNAHVIKGADEIKIVLSDGREFDARSTVIDEPSDLALLRIITPND